MSVGNPNWKKDGKGVSGNPSGRPKGYGEMVKRCRDLTPKVIARLAKVLEGPEDKYALGAASQLMDRAWGKASQPTIDQTKRAPVGDRLTGLTDDEVTALARGQLKALVGREPN